MTKIIQLPLQTRQAEFRAASFNETDNTIDIVWTTGASVRRRSWVDGPYDEQLEVGPNNVRLGRLNSGAPFLNTHGTYDLSDVLGSIVQGSAKIENGRGLATVLLSRAPSDADTVMKIRDGVIRNVSAGYAIHEVTKTERDNGQVPLWRITDWEPFEISAVPIGADPNAQTRSAAVAGAALFECRLSNEPHARSALARMRMRNAQVGLGRS